MSRLRIRLLGVPAVELDGTALVDLGPKATALLAYLAMQKDGRASRAELSGLLWEDAPSCSAARHALRQCLLRVRRMLSGVGPVLAADESAIWLTLTGVEIDVRQMHAALDDDSADTVIAAAALCRGPFCHLIPLDGPGFGTWLRQTRSEVDMRAAELTRRAALALEARGLHAEASRMATRCVELEPYDDSAHALLIHLLMRAGRILEARAAHLACRRTFAEDLGIDAGPEVDAALACLPVRARRTPIRDVSPPDAPVTLQRPQMPRRAAALCLVAGVVLLIAVQEPQPVPSLPQAPSLSARLWVAAEAAESGPKKGAGVEAGNMSEKEVRNATNQRKVMPSSENVEIFARTYPIGC